MSNQREHPRESIEFVLKYREASKAAAFEYAYYENISVGGVCLSGIEKELAVDSIIEIELSLPASMDSTLMNSVKVMGRVAHCGKSTQNDSLYNCGIQFLEMGEEKQQSLVKFLKSL